MLLAGPFIKHIHYETDTAWKIDPIHENILLQKSKVRDHSEYIVQGGGVEFFKIFTPTSEDWQNLGTPLHIIFFNNTTNMFFLALFVLLNMFKFF